MVLMAPRPKARARSRSIAILVFVLTGTVHAQTTTGNFGGPGNNFASPGVAFAQPDTKQPLFTYGVDAGIGESDNVGLSSSDKISQTIATTDFDFSLNEQSRLLGIKATGDFSYLDYLQNAYGNQLLGRFDGTGSFALIPERLVWVVRDDFGQSAVDALSPVTPNNIENINYFSTGPDVYFRLGAVNFLNASVRYARAQFQSSPFDSNRVLGSLSIGRNISAGADVSLNGETEHVMFDNTTVNTNFERTSAFAQYKVHGARTDLEADLGVTTIDPSTGQSNTGPLAKVLLTRKVSPRAVLTVTVGKELTDSSSSFGTLQSSNLSMIGSAGAIVTTSPYTSEFASAGWTYTFSRTSLGVTARWEKDTYTRDPEFNVRRPGFEVNAERKLSRSLTAQVLGSYYKSHYPNAVVASAAESSDFADSLIGLALTWRHGRGLEIKLRGDHDYHGVDTGISGYHENRLFLTVGYRPTPIGAVESAD
jgi:hypothetical protein